MKKLKTYTTRRFVKKTFYNIEWPILYDIKRDWNRGTLIIEPREALQETYEFLMLRDVESILIYTYFYNPYSSTPKGWGASTGP